MSLKRTFSLLLLFLVCCSIKTTNAQNFGGNPPFVKWRSINTDSIRIIFPAGLEQEATRAANVIGYIAKNRTVTVGPKVRKLKLVFQNQTLIPNGYVGLAPYRSEFFVTPPQDLQMLGSLSWLDVLAVHEYRHALQFSNHKRGVNNLLYLFQGETGWALGEALLFPPWYYEGDAVTTETALTSAGRGRTPSFLAPLRSIASDDIKVSYVALRNGSYNRNLPDHYAYGYLMSAYGREKFGNDFWKKVSRSTTNLHGIFYPFGNSVKKYARVRPQRLYNNAMLDFSASWVANTQHLKIVEGSEVVLPIPKEYTSYSKPTLINSSELLAVRKSFSDLMQVVNINLATGAESPLFAMGQGSDGSYTYSAGKVMWCVARADIRWQNQSTNSIYTYSMATQKVERLIKSARYLSPALSHDGKRLAVVNISPELKSSIDILNAETGEVEQSLPNSLGFEIYTPSWSLGDTSLVMVAKQQGKLAIVDQNVQSGLVTNLHGWTSNVIANPTLADGSLFFEASYGGIDNIYKLNISTGEVVQATSAQVGANQPYFQNGMVAYSRYSLLGNRIMLIKDGEFAKPLDMAVEPVDEQIYGTELAKLEGGSILDSIPNRIYDIKSYHQGLHLLNIHSWGLQVQNGYSGAQIASTDVLNKLMIQGSFLHNSTENSNSFMVSALYGGWYPYVGASFQRINDRKLSFNLSGISWNETVVAGSLQLPLNLSSRLFSRRVTLSGNVESYRVDYTGFATPEYFNTILFKVDFVNLMQQVRKNLNPRWGQALSASYQRILNGNSLYSGKEVVTLRGSLFMPGIGQNHSLNFSGVFRNETMNNLYNFSDTVSISRGYYQYDFDRLTRLTAQYSFPISYPDMGVNGLFFVKRLRANLFYDYTKGNFSMMSNSTLELSSCGVELVADMTIFNWFQIPYGFRYSYLLDKDPRHAARKDFFEVFIRVTSL